MRHFAYFEFKYLNIKIGDQAPKLNCLEELRDVQVWAMNKLNCGFSTGVS